MPDGPVMRERPTLILLHGGPGMDHSSFRPAFSQFADIAQVIYIDHRGNGRSDRQPRTTWTLAQWGDDLYEFCRALEIERPIVMGQSFGGMVAMAYATRHPEHPAKLILSSTAAQGQAHVERSIELFRQRGGDEIAEMARHALTVGYDSPEFAVKWMAAGDAVLQRRKPTPDPDARARSVMTAKVLMDFLGPGGEGLTFDMLADLAKIQCPDARPRRRGGPHHTDRVVGGHRRRDPAEWVRFERFAGAATASSATTPAATTSSATSSSGSPCAFMMCVAGERSFQPARRSTMRQRRRTHHLAFRAQRGISPQSPRFATCDSASAANRSRGALAPPQRRKSPTCAWTGRVTGVTSPAWRWHERRIACKHPPL